MPYFDHNATAPLAPVAREAWLRAQDEAWQNPSSPHRAGSRARLRLDAARATLALLLGAEPARVVFTSGATEGARAVFAHWAATLGPEARIAVSPTEHPCTLAAAVASFGSRVVRLPVDAAGRVTVAAVRAALADGARGVAVMAANNETGVVQPWSEIAQACRAAGVPCFCDATQWLGKLPAAGLGGAGWVTGSAHKFGGPKGVGFVVLPAEDPGFCIQPGGVQERGHRSGTEDVAGAMAMVAALADAEQRKVFLESGRLLWREAFERAVTAAVPGARVVAAGADRLWNTVSLILPHGENTRWVARLDKRDFQVSTGSACAVGKAGPSHVLAAMGVPAPEARRVVRVSAGWETTEADWLALAEAFRAVAAELAADAPDNVVAG